MAKINPDLKRFKQMTENNIVIMGRKTLDSLPNGEPLPNRTNIVLTRDKGYTKQGITAMNSIKLLKTHIELLEKVNKVEAFVIGGGEIYVELLKFCDTVYATKIKHKFEADTYFPNLDKLKDWIITDVSETYNENGIEYEYVTYERID